MISFFDLLYRRLKNHSVTKKNNFNAFFYIDIQLISVLFAFKKRGEASKMLVFLTGFIFTFTANLIIFV